MNKMMNELKMEKEAETGKVKFDAVVKEMKREKKIETFEISNIDKSNTLNWYDRIEVGVTFKDFTELCLAFGMEPLKGNSKIAQLKKIETMIDYERIGNKYKVTAIYKQPRNKIDKRTIVKDNDGRHLGNNSKYIQILTDILTYELFKDGKSNPELTYLDLLEKINVTTDCLYQVLYDFPDSEKYNEMSLRLALCSAKDRLRGIVIRTLDSMQRNKIIEYHEVYYYYRNYMWVEANEKDIQYIKKTNMLVLKSFGPKATLFQIQIKNLMDKYQAELLKRYYLDKDWSNVYKAYKFKLKGKIKLKELAYIQTMRKELVCMLKEMLIKDAENRKNNSLKKFGKTVFEIIDEEFIEKLNNDEHWTLEELIEATEVKDAIKFKYPDNYLDEQKKIINKILRIA